MNDADGQMKISRDGKIIDIAFNRPDRRNAITHAMYAAFADALDALGTDDGLRAGLIRGEGEAFTAGNDLMDFAAGFPGDAEPPVWRFLRTILTMEKPLIAAVNGPAVGVGLTMLLHCDVVIASETATFSAPFVKLGVVPEAGSSVLLPRTVGMALANDIMLGGRVLTAEEALSAGLVSTVVAPGELAQAARARAETFAAFAPRAMSRAKKLMRHDAAEIAAVMEREAVIFNEQLKSPEFAESAAAFMQKRAPKFD